MKNVSVFVKESQCGPVSVDLDSTDFHCMDNAASLENRAGDNISEILH